MNCIVCNEKRRGTVRVKLSKITNILKGNLFYSTSSFSFSLAPQPSLGLGLLHKIQLNFLETFQQFSSLEGRFVSPTPNSHPGGPGLCIYIPQRQGG
jgi:hypothetical protein